MRLRRKSGKPFLKKKKKEEKWETEDHLIIAYIAYILGKGMSNVKPATSLTYRVDNSSSCVSRMLSQLIVR
jgi:hypothetical protein